MTSSAPQPGGWNMRLALGVLAVLMIVVALVIAIGVRMFDRFDTLTELLIGAVFFVAILGLNGAVIYCLNAMGGKGGEHGGSS